MLFSAFWFPFLVNNELVFILLICRFYLPPCSFPSVATIVSDCSYCFHFLCSLFMVKWYFTSVVVRRLNLQKSRVYILKI